MGDISHIGQIAITVSNVKEALSFYRDQLGLEFLFAPSDQLAFLQCGASRLMLTEPQGAGEAGQNSILYYQVSDIEAKFQALKESGVHCEREPELAAAMPDHDLWLAFLRDPEGNLLALMEEKAKSA
ncbi:VOC family protein [uncultured Pseudoteredinibacter sp.]|uniref:VOC family protein n=1 Tax=uncultured Pseudoteredinibacter sp. TaxID=1641701 RepID=UPI00262DCEBE|nr:VOC family protein [uncultured Pseudoteredinibacter sp.]